MDEYGVEDRKELSLVLLLKKEKEIKKSLLTEVDEYGVEDRKELPLVDRSRGEDEGAEARVGACAVN